MPKSVGYCTLNKDSCILDLGQTCEDYEVVKLDNIPTGKCGYVGRIPQLA